MRKVLQRDARFEPEQELCEYQVKGKQKQQREERQGGKSEHAEKRYDETDRRREEAQVDEVMDMLLSKRCQ